MKLNDRETAIILAALREWQQHSLHSLEMDQIASGGDEFEPLDDDEIDVLCERLNCEEEDQ